MQMKKLLQSLAVALPMLTLAACSSTSDSDAMTGTDGSYQNGGVQTGAQNGGALSADEQMRQQYEALRRENVIYFEFDQDEVTGHYAQVLEAHASFLRSNPNVSILVEGHADERGTPEYNIALGERRAKAVTSYLQSLGVSGSQLAIVSYGEEKPLDTSRSEDGFAKNRRAVLVY
ncbi:MULTISPECIES: peptidoglycan-associated lipoprotein Pal [Oceanimonas]|uniref:Peptidoglycan-associated lipoprotein n=1 Tax=Oceanimonas doudoroffii TaxID=84158 RepID=A0A233REW5_9GAMM|nr:MULTISPECIES: peptidoglycan-associated lipoprotein Pal [Oceanimonas]NHI01460.1 Peptidoglycan-associated lipoprotein [Oceanimonas sp. MB9]OXY81940.1 peptidoglycan-associated lipoprotein [Oceanimonas doudoroffii]